MYQLDFEEFLIANGFGTEAIAMLRQAYENRQSLSEEHHNHVLDLFRRYLLRRNAWWLRIYVENQKKLLGKEISSKTFVYVHPI